MYKYSILDRIYRIDIIYKIDIIDKLDKYVTGSFPMRWIIVMFKQFKVFNLISII